MLSIHLSNCLEVQVEELSKDAARRQQDASQQEAATTKIALLEAKLTSREDACTEAAQQADCLKRSEL